MPSFRVLVAQMSHETNTFNPLPTTLEDFEASGLYIGDGLIERLAGTRTEPGGFIDTLEAAGVEVVGGVSAAAVPSGPVSAEAFAFMEEAIAKALGEGRVDGVLLALHGAMVITGGELGELGLVRRLRRRVGPRVPIVCTLDLHAHLSEELIALATAVIPYDTNPHNDRRERGEEAARLMLGTLEGTIRPVGALHTLPLLTSILAMYTAEVPMKRIMDAALEWEARPGILNVGIVPGFPFSDVEHAGFAVVVTADGDARLAAEAARSVAGVAWSLRHAFARRLPSPAEALERARPSGKGLLLVAEVADNVNGGAPGDGTHVLAALLRAPVKSAVCGALRHAAAVGRAIATGVGNTGRFQLGGQVSPLSGPALEVEARVRLVSDGRFVNCGPYNGPAMLPGSKANMGRTAVLDVKGHPGEVAVVVTERPTPTIDPELFRSLGIEPAQLSVLVVKARAHYWRPYDFVRDLVEVNTPGHASPDLSTFPYRRLRRPIFPLDPVERIEWS